MRITTHLRSLFIALLLPMAVAVAVPVHARKPKAPKGYKLVWADEFKKSGALSGDWPYDKPFYLILNLAWGGSWGGQQGIDESALPVTMDVDYVRVYQK